LLTPKLVLPLLLAWADVQMLISPGFLELRGVHRFVMVQGSRTVRFTTTDDIGPFFTAHNSDPQNQYAANQEEPHTEPPFVRSLL